MPDAYWLERSLNLETASRVVDVALVGCLVVAVAVGWLTGLPPAVLAPLVVGSVVLEHAASWFTRRQILRTAEEVGSEPDDQLRTAVADLADRIGVPAPRIVVEESLGAGVTVMQGSEGPVLLLSRAVRNDLDSVALRGVIAHELAHLDGGHINWLDSRDPVAHVVGATAFWVVAGQHLSPMLGLVGAATYVGVGVFGTSMLSQLYYLGASLGVVLLPLGLIAFAHRLEEHQADDRAVGVTDPTAFCRGLARVAAIPEATSLPEDLLGTVSTGEQRGLIARVTATHPPLERRFARYGLTVDDVVEK